MAEVKIVADRYVVCSTITLKDFNKLKKYRPEAFIIRDEDKNEVFQVKIGPVGGIGRLGVVFNSTTNDANEFLTMTGTIPVEPCCAKEYVVEQVRLALPQLKKVEDRVAAALEGIDTEISSIEASISTIL